MPVLRRETAARRDPGTPEAPTHASLVRATYGDQPARQPRPNADRGDNVTGRSPYEDSDADAIDAINLDSDLMRLATGGSAR